MLACRTSPVARSDSTSCVFVLRVCSLVASSLSHQPLCSASLLASCSSLWINSSINCFTFAKGSASALLASASSSSLWSLSEVERRNSATFIWLRAALKEVRLRPGCRSEACDPEVEARSCARERWGSATNAAAAGRCFSAVPETSALAMISFACVNAPISSLRRACLFSNWLDFLLQVVFKFSRYSSSSASSLLRSCTSATALAEAWSSLARAFCELASPVCSALMLSAKSCIKDE
mmetsp:Transcript_31701/g.47782  ORF Transcript_31701/g.47782 Transcript_31701/m.47782 type:complete len:237 (-) Transcript_31701:27-737(-)